jgi:hypothetical protein
MGILDRFRKNPEEQATRESIENAQKEIVEALGPLEILVELIAQATAESFEHFCDVITKSKIEIPANRMTFIFLEFLYFYMHLTNRAAHHQGLSESQRAKIRSFMGPRLQKVSADAFFIDWPVDFKIDMTKEFFSGANRLEIEYSSCRKAKSDQNEVGDDSLIGKLTIKLSYILGVPSHPTIYSLAELLVSRGLTILSFEKTITDITTTIDHVEPELLSYLEEHIWD